MKGKLAKSRVLYKVLVFVSNFIIGSNLLLICLLTVVVFVAYEVFVFAVIVVVKGLDKSVVATNYVCMCTVYLGSKYA